MLFDRWVHVSSAHAGDGAISPHSRYSREETRQWSSVVDDDGASVDLGAEPSVATSSGEVIPAGS
jgi:hypothetical protein